MQEETQRVDIKKLVEAAYPKGERKFEHPPSSADDVFGDPFEATVKSDESPTEPMPRVEQEETQPVQSLEQPVPTAGSTPDLGSQTTGQKIGNFLRSVFT